MAVPAEDSLRRRRWPGHFLACIMRPSESGENADGMCAGRNGSAMAI